MPKLLIAGQEAWKTHEVTGARFLIRPVTPERYKELRKKATGANGDVDFIKFCGLIGPEVIGDWEGVGTPGAEIPCNAENAMSFSKNLAAAVMPWIIDEATSLDRFRLEEKDAAKKD